MPTESKTLTEQRVRKERALATMREIQLEQLRGALLPVAEVERTWAEAMFRLRSAMLAIPSRCAGRFPNPQAAEAIIRAEVESALKQLAGRA